MAFPQRAAHAATTGTGSDHDPVVADLPAGIVSGSLLIARLVLGEANSSPALSSVPSGWTQLGTAAINSNDGRLWIGYRNADGTEGSTVSFDLNIPSNFSCRITRYSGHHASSPPELSTIATAAGTTSPNPPSLTPSWGAADTTWEAIVGAMASDTVTAYPANFTDGTNDQASGIDAVELGVAYREENATSQDPGAFTMNGNFDTAAATLAIRPAPPAVSRGLMMMGMG